MENVLEKDQPLSTPLPIGSEWTFEMIERYDQQISRVARHYGLDWYRNQFEVITAEQMMDAAALRELLSKKW